MEMVDKRKHDVKYQSNRIHLKTRKLKLNAG